MLFFRKTYFSSKRQKFSTILKMQVSTKTNYIIVNIIIVWYEVVPNNFAKLVYE